MLFILGLAVALLAYLPVDWFVRWLRQKSELPPREPRKEAVPVFIIGTFERLLAFSLVYLNVEGAYAILIAWMAAKLAAGWSRQPLSGGRRNFRLDGREARANLSQLRVVDTRRLERKIGFLDKETFVHIRKAARELL